MDVQTAAPEIDPTGRPWARSKKNYTPRIIQWGRRLDGIFHSFCVLLVGRKEKKSTIMQQPSELLSQLAPGGYSVNRNTGTNEDDLSTSRPRTR